MSPLKLKRLIQLSRRVGREIPHWVQGAGANLSIKEKMAGQTTLWIKPSGMRLDQLKSIEDLCRVQVDEVKRGLRIISAVKGSKEGMYAKLIQQCGRNFKGRRPSMETGLHAILPGTWVFHFHSLAALIMADLYFKGNKQVKVWMDNNWVGRAAFIDPVMPGWELCRRLAQVKNSNAVFLACHGVVLQGQDPAVLRKWRRLEKLFLKQWKIKDVWQRGTRRSIENKPTPLKLYMPDSAVFIKRMRDVLVRAGRMNGRPLFRLSQGAWRRDKDASELWTATEILYHLNPRQKELPERISSIIAQLPTEKIRLQVHGRGRR